MTSRLEHDDPELGPVRLCRKCGEEWPRDREFWYFTAAGKVLGPCKACWADTQRARRSVMIRAAAILALTLAASTAPVVASAVVPVHEPRHPELGPTEDVVPVAPYARETAAAPDLGPTAIGGQPVAWPRLWAGETGVVSTYGRGYDGLLALPWPWCGGWLVEITGQAGTVRRTSNDCGPERSLHRVADVDVATFEAISGQSWRMGLTTATVRVIGRAK